MITNQTGYAETLFGALFTSPATVTDAFLNGEGISIFDVLNFLGIDGGQLTSLPAIDFGDYHGLIPNTAWEVGDPLNQAIINGTAHLDSLSVTDIDATFPLNGLLAPMQNPFIGATLNYTGGDVAYDHLAAVTQQICFFGCHTIQIFPEFQADPLNLLAGDVKLSPEYTGTQFGGLVPALLNWAPHQLQDVINDPVTASWQDIATGFQNLPQYLSDQFQLTSLFGPEGWLGLLASTTGLGDLPALFDPGAITGLSGALPDLFSLLSF